MAETGSLTVRKRLYFWGKILVVIAVVWIVLVIWNPGILFRAANPVPEIDGAVIDHHRLGRLEVPAEDIRELQSLFDVSRGDPFNTIKWKVNYTVDATLKSGDRVRISIYSTRAQYWAAFRLDGAGFNASYYRGGTNKEFDAFLDNVASAKGKSTSVQKTQ